ncbi:cytochrome c oxidase assembly protein (plasmid) [Rhodococcus opacus]|uniref:cytochrome c oxidase assembly protein n=1 Tax=Rhodococcus opacus TaxID=37919 RepID=UPI001FF2CF64|nr:cytochrome c oxidase assembly protein [Rhodococcus opacus]UOT08544.1 cytochrome c oxidase assembly protein [Rhodococcus opacus]
MINAAVRVPVGELLSSTYGMLVLAKVAALVVVGVLGWRQRVVAVTALAADPQDRSMFTRLAVVETAILMITIGIAVALGRTPPPPPRDRREPSAVEEILGYPLTGPPTGLRLVLDWRFDLLFGTLALILAAGYLLGVRRVHTSGVRRWPPARTVSWVSGCVLVLLATSSGVGRFAPAVFSVHTGAVAVLAILAPLALAAGAPLTLARAAVADTDTGTGTGTDAAVPGPRDWLRELQNSAPIRAVTHPVVVWVLFVGGFFVFYLGGLYNAVGGSHVAHVLANAYFLIAGYLLFWVGLGVDPTWRPPLSRRAGITLLTTALGGYLAFALILRTTSTVIAGQYYTSLRRGWFEDLAADQRLGAAIALAAGLIALVIAVTVRARPG